MEVCELDYQEDPHYFVVSASERTNGFEHSSPAIVRSIAPTTGAVRQYRYTPAIRRSG